MAIQLKYKCMFNFAGMFPSAMTSPPSSFKYSYLKDFWINPRFDYPALLRVNGVKSEIKGLPPGDSDWNFSCNCGKQYCRASLSGVCFLGSDTSPQYLAYTEYEIGFYVAPNSWDWYSVCQGRSETNFTKVKGGERAEKSRVKSVAAYGGRLLATASDAGLVKLWSFKKAKQTK